MGFLSQSSKPLSSQVLFVFSVLIITLPNLSSASENGTLSAYDILLQYDLPVGLLPKGATGYKINRETGEFEAYLDKTCKFSLENSYDLEYKSTIKGVISKGRLKNLKGVSVKVLILWLNIAEVVRDGDELEFSVGIASADFPIDNFEESPQCGCGLNCDTLNSVLSSSSI
ncbi:hypothetical protein FEM48_Zijuj09G0020800 [Ziziphus jujuba var. spinosa]|nr:hypothetical protein FEM48_Zijuj09G0020800 [Ziziphus jujuba var. spinosa]